MNLEKTECIVEVLDFTQRAITNICTGETLVIQNGSMEMAGMALVGAPGFAAVVILLGLLVEIMRGNL